MRERHLRTLFICITGVCTVLGASLLATTAQAAEESDWHHALQVAEDLRTSPPGTPVVLLIGGSAAREATVSDSRWATDVLLRGGPSIAAYNLGSKNQTFEQDVALVKALPKIPMLIFIGVNRGRFAGYSTNTTSTKPEATKAASHGQHHYVGRPSLTPERKQEEVRAWMRERHPVFARRIAGNMAQLDTLIAACKERGYQPVVLGLPRNMEAIGDAFDAPIEEYQQGCRTVAAKHGIRFIDFVDAAQLKDEDFFDLNHLVDSGWPKFQGLLADETLVLLEPDAIAGGEGFVGALGRFASGVRSRLLWPFGSAVLLLGVALVVQRRRAVVRRRRKARQRRQTGAPAAAFGSRPATFEDDRPVKLSWLPSEDRG